MKKCLAVCACLILFSFILIPQSKVYSQRRDTRQLYADDSIVVKLKAEVETNSDADLMAEEIVRAPGVRAEALTTRPQAGIQLIHLNRSISVAKSSRLRKSHFIS